MGNKTFDNLILRAKRHAKYTKAVKSMSYVDKHLYDYAINVLGSSKSNIHSAGVYIQGEPHDIILVHSVEDYISFKGDKLYEYHVMSAEEYDSNPDYNDSKVNKLFGQFAVNPDKFTYKFGDKVLVPAGITIFDVREDLEHFVDRPTPAKLEYVRVIGVAIYFMYGYQKNKNRIDRG